MLVNSLIDTDEGQTVLTVIIAALFAGWVTLFGVEIDATMETLIVAVAPGFVAYWWPTKDSDSTGWKFRSGVGWTLGSALVAYVVAQLVIKVGLIKGTVCTLGNFVVGILPFFDVAQHCETTVVRVATVAIAMIAVAVSVFVNLVGGGGGGGEERQGQERRTGA
jgi:hypothetical protein